MDLRRLTLLLMLPLLAIAAQAQRYSFAQVDSLTWAQYQRGDYRDLLATGRDALQEGIDFYYLRLRLGEAAYRLERYDEAASHFEPVLEKYPEDTLAQEFLYYCYLFTAQDQRAALVGEQMPPSLRERVGYHRRPLDAVGVEGGYLSNNNARKYETSPMTNDDSTGFVFGQFAGKLLYGKLMVQHSLHPRLQFTHAVAWFSTSTLGKFQAPNDTVLQYFSNGNLQYNLGASVQLNKGWKVAAGFGYYYQSLTGYTIQHPDSMNPGPPTVVEDTTVDNNVAALVSVRKRFRNLEAGLQASLSNFPDTAWYQAEANVVWYPTRKSTLYTSTSAGVIHSDRTFLILTQRLGLRLTPKVWWEVSGAVGNHKNYLSSLGFITWNTNDPILWMAGTDFNLYLGHLVLSPSYRYQLRNGAYQNADPGQLPVDTNFRFDNHFFNISVLWKF